MKDFFNKLNNTNVSVAIIPKHGEPGKARVGRPYEIPSVWAAVGVVVIALLIIL